MRPDDIPAYAKTDSVFLNGRAVSVRSAALVESTYRDDKGQTQVYGYVAVSVNDLPEWSDLRQPASRKMDVPATRKSEHLERVRASGKTSEQHEAILTFLRTNSLRPWTRQELAKKLEMPINVVCPRVHELLTSKPPRLVVAGNQRCTVTGQPVEGVIVS